MSLADPKEDEEWMPGGGDVSERTNRLIDTLVRTMNEQGVYQFRPSDVEEVAARILPVGHEDTLAEYRVRALKYGPFERRNSGWALAEKYRKDSGRGTQ